MKILFLHISDTHFKENTKYSEINISAMVNSLREIGEFDECVIVYSGDVVQSGEFNQYKFARGFLGRLIKSIKDKYLPEKIIQTLIVPGNHDVLVQNPERGLNELKGYYSSPQETEKKFYNELSQLKNFYLFANRNYCYLDEKKVIDVRRICFDKFVIKVNLINSAPFSLLCDGNEDKGLHFLPQKEIDKLSLNYEEKYAISVMHHGPEWFENKSKQALYNKLYECSDLIFVGHEHFSLSQNKIVNGKHKVDISSGVALYGTNTEHGFNTIILDTEQRTLKGAKFIYNGKIYKPTPNLDNPSIGFRGKYNFTYTPKFTSDLESDVDERNGEKYLDYFVFPSLEAKNINSDFKSYSVTTEEKLMELIGIKNRITIEGSSRAGKTILSKYICRLLLEDYVPIYLNEECFAPKDNKKVIKYAFEDQYGDSADIDEFYQLDKAKKVLIVDSYDRLDRARWKLFWDEIKNEFGHVILFCGIDWSLNIREKTLEELSDNKFFYLRICPFYYTKREQLIQKICNNFQEHKIYEVEEKTRKINEDITNQIKYFQLTPDFIHQYVDYYLNYTYTNINSETNVFSKVFEANIIYRLAKHAGEDNVNEIMTALDFVAYYIHFHKKYPLSISEFESIIEEYNKKYDMGLIADNIYKKAIKSNILKEVPGKSGVKFCDENLLAYFTAIHLNRMFNESEGTDELRSVLNNICFPPNGDIILFLTYITSNVKILNPIMNSIIEHMDNWEELSLDGDNIGYLSKMHVVQKAKLPSAKDKQNMKEEKENIEKDIVEKHVHESEVLYSYDESNSDTFENKMTKSINYLELVAKILPNFRHLLIGETKKRIVNILYTYPNKLLYFMLDEINNKHDEIVNEILDRAPKTRKGKLITRDVIVNEIQNQSMAYILSIYDFVASTASTPKTISDLNKAEYFDYGTSTNYILQNILMEENVGNFKSMAYKAENLYFETKLDIVKQMLTLIVRKYFLCHDIAIKGDVQHTIDVFFKEDKDEKKAIQLLQVRNRIVKK